MRATTRASASAPAVQLPLTFQWYRNGALLGDGGTLPGHGLRPRFIQRARSAAAYYSVTGEQSSREHSKRAGSAYGGGSRDQRDTPPTRLGFGEERTLSVTAPERAPLTYQWWKNTVALAAAQRGFFGVGESASTATPRFYRDRRVESPTAVSPAACQRDGEYLHAGSPVRGWVFRRLSSQHLRHPADGRILVGGEFIFFRDQHLPGSHPLNRRCTLERPPSLALPKMATASVRALAIQNDGKSWWAARSSRPGERRSRT